MKKIEILKEIVKFIILYIVIFLWAMTWVVIDLIYLFQFTSYNEMSFFNTFLFGAMVMSIESLIATIIYYIFFNVIYKITLKNIFIYFLMWFISFMKLMAWQSEHTFINDKINIFIFTNYEIILLIIYTAIICILWYYVKKQKKSIFLSKRL